jgi:N-acetylneuraminic acid mutarotase
MFTPLVSSRWLLAVALASSFWLSAPGAQAQKWSRAAPFPEASEELYGIAAGGKLHVFGGLAPGWTPKGLVYEYDPGSDTWTKKKNMPLASHHVALAEVKGKIYVLGGFTKPEKGPTAWVPIDNAWEYDPAADTWKALAPLPTKRGSPNAVVHDGKIYVIGGAGLHPGSKETAVHPARPHRSLGTNEVYDPATNTWEARQPMPTPRNHAAAGLVNGKIYVIGGRIGAAFITRASNIGIVEEYDPATDQWGALKASMLNPRSAGAWGTYKGRIYVAGGEERSSGPWQRTFRAVEAFDPATNRWSMLPDMTFPRHGLAGDILNGKFHLVSGDIASGGGPGTHIDTDVHEVLDIEGR